MTSHNARLNQASDLNNQIRAAAMQMALQSRDPQEPWDLTMKRAQDIYDFMRVTPPGSLELVSANDLPKGAA